MMYTGTQYKLYLADPWACEGENKTGEVKLPEPD